MDFIRVAYKENKDGTREYYPSLQALESSDLVIRGGQFQAVWDESAGLYSRRLSHLADVIDRSFNKMVAERIRPGDTVKKVRVYDNQIYSRLMGLVRNIGDMGPELDQKIIFANEVATKKDAATFKMPYALSDAEPHIWNEIIGTLYAEEERLKIEWAIGSIFSGASVEQVQKFYVFFGPPGSGKSTILNIIEKLFEGHASHFSAYDMGRGDAQFSLEPFAKNPLVAVDQDGDLSRIELNKNLNSIVSHDRVLINSKGKTQYEIKPRATLFIGTNEPIKISNRKSGLFRRLVDIQPTGMVFNEEHYHHLMSQVQFELGSIATHCMRVFNELGPTYLSSYRSTDMMYRTNDIFNFVEDNRLILSKGATIKQIHKMYQEWCSETDTRNVYKQYQLRDLLADYFEEFHDQIMLDGNRFRSYFTGLKAVEQFTGKPYTPPEEKDWLDLKEQPSILDELLKDQKAQYSTGNDKFPLKQPWDEVTTTLSDLDTSKEHYTKVPLNHIVLDFDLKDENGRKDLGRNLRAAAVLPPSYAEVSRGGNGLHIHYLYAGDPERLANGAEDGSYEIKTLLGGAGLRRKLSACNDLEIVEISAGLPLKEEKVLSPKVMSSEKTLRGLILRGLNKEIHPGTKSNMDFIEKVLQDAYTQGMVYDVSDMWDDIVSFAMGSTNQRDTALEIAMRLKLKSEEEVADLTIDTDKPIAYFDCEVFPNLFAIGWIYEDAPDEQVVLMLDPSPQDVEDMLTKLRLVGYNCRMYDNHILHAVAMGYSNEELYRLSQKIVVEKNRNAMFGAAYNASYADIYDYASEKKSLKKWEIELGLPHKELDHPWNEPVPEEKVPEVMAYLKNDVLATRAVAKAREGDFRARAILAELSGLEIINTTRQHTERLIFGGVKDVSQDLEYTDLHMMFPGYKFDKFAPGKEKSSYRGEFIGEGGLVRSQPGMYENVALLDVASMHPTSIVQLNLFGQYTERFKALMDTRLALKQGRLEDAAKQFDGKLAEFVKDPAEAKVLSNALKLVINSVYGYTAATFPNKFKDERNQDNIVAKRGALFMMDLREFVKEQGFEVIHIKTDSVKIPGATPELIEKVMEFGQKYGYEFEHEATYEKFCLVNDAVYVARENGKWTAVGAQFQHPVVFKTLFTHEDIDVFDYVETKQVSKGEMYLVSLDGEVRQFVGKFGAFIPVLNGRRLMRIDGDKAHSVTGTKDYLWELDDVVMVVEKELEVDMSYFEDLVNDGMRTIEKFGSFQEFVK